jgi:transcription initiation factor TFIID subunit 7
MQAPVARPKLKISVSQTKIGTPTQSAAATPLTTPGGKTKIVLKGLPAAQAPGDHPSTPGAAVATPVSTTTKAGRKTKPTAKKREHDELGDDTALEVRPPPPKKAKHIKILPVTPSTPKDAGRSIVIKHIGKAPKRPPGDGYDSEASDKEDDPAIEEQIMFRMFPGEDCDFLRQQVMENKLGTGKENPGFSLMWLEEETRRAVITVRGQVYVGVLVDLPTITEGMKTFDKKNIMKTADISQMLFIFQKVASIDEARKAPLPAALEPPFKWPHGITPPMHDCVHRRFSKKMSRKDIEDKEAEVERLLNLDRQAKSTRYEHIDDRAAKTPAPDDDDEDDAEGEEEEEDGYFPHQAEADASAENDMLLEEELIAAFEEEETLATQMEGVTPVTGDATPAAGIRETVEVDEGSSEEEEDDEDDDDDDDDEDLDEDEQARMDEVKGVRAMIADLKTQLKAKETELQNATNSIIIKRLEDSIRKLKSEIQLKMSSIGEEEEEAYEAE